jgi:lysophospholipase L1-like esterase
MPVVYGDPVVANGKEPVTRSCTPASGSTFPVGTTSVTCTATDALQRTSSCAFAVTVNPPPRITLTRFSAFGDSITAGEDGQFSVTSVVGGRMVFLNPVVNPAIAYPTVLQQALKVRYQLQADSIVVENRGEPGQAAADPETPDFFRRSIVGRQAVLILIGSNDLYIAHQLTDVYGRVTEGVNAVQGLVRMAKGSNVRVYLATIPPMNPAGPRGFSWDLVAGFNDRIRGIAASENVTLVDVYNAFNGDLSLLSGDGLHPNASGYERIANTFFESIKATLEQSTAPGLQPMLFRR